MSDSPSAPVVLPELWRPTGGLHGRDDELAVIAEAWARARDGSGQVVFVEAAAGQGKSSLVAHAVQAAVESGKATPAPRLVFGTAHRDSYLSFEPFNLAINQWCARADIDDLRRTVDGWVGPTLKSMVPVLWERITDLADPPEADIAGLGMRVVDAVTGFFANLTRLGPVVCVLEDLHWADEDTVRLLAELLAASRDWPMLVIATARANEMSSVLQDLRTSLVGRDGFVAVELGPLSPEVTAAVIADAIGKVPGPPRWPRSSAPPAAMLCGSWRWYTG